MLGGLCARGTEDGRLRVTVEIGSKCGGCDVTRDGSQIFWDARLKKSEVKVPKVKSQKVKVLKGQKSKVKVKVLKVKVLKVKVLVVFLIGCADGGINLDPGSRTAWRSSVDIQYLKRARYHAMLENTRLVDCKRTHL